MERHRGEREAATALLRESLELRRTLGDRDGVAECLEALASAAGGMAEAGRLFGAAAALRDAIGIPIPSSRRADYEADVAAVRAVLDDDAFAAAWAEGRAMTPEQAVAYALGEAASA